jgi:UDP-glucose 4-epimerase
MDTTRFVAATGLRPRFTSRAALEEFVGVSSPGLLRPERVDQVLAGVTGLLDAAGQRPGSSDG